MLTTQLHSVAYTSRSPPPLPTQGHFGGLSFCLRTTFFTYPRLLYSGSLVRTSLYGQSYGHGVWTNVHTGWAYPLGVPPEVGPVRRRSTANGSSTLTP